MSAKLYFAVEEDDTDLRRYKSVHAWGCRDLRDPERVVVESIDDIYYDLVGYGVIEEGEGWDELKPMLAPCARKLIDEAARR